LSVANPAFANRFTNTPQMIANAGVLGRPGLTLVEGSPTSNGAISSDVLSVSSEEWDRVMNINARGVFLCYKYAGLQMIKQGRGGRIVGASSRAGKQGNCSSLRPLTVESYLTQFQGVATQVPYSASKFAIRGLTQAAGTCLGVRTIVWNRIAI
jgi:NAD(P)-dependent dehydrogenase (short-subunit alcohol dehydrogenase family)